MSTTDEERRRALRERARAWLLESDEKNLLSDLTDLLLSVSAEAEAREREACEAVAKAYRGAAERRRKQLGQKLSRFEPDAQADILSEERGEDIAADEIAAAIRARGAKDT